MPEKENSGVVVKESRSVVRKFLARPQSEGVGAIVRRSIGRWEKKKKKTHMFLFLVAMKWMRIWDGFAWMGSCVVSGLSWDTLIRFLLWMNSQVGYSVSFPLFFSVFIWYVVTLFTEVFFLFFMLMVLCTAVTAPAGFPDHPHRGLIFLRKFILLDYTRRLRWIWLFCFLFNRIWDSDIHVAGINNLIFCI